MFFTSSASSSLWSSFSASLASRKETDMPNIFVIIGAVVVIIAILSFLGLS
ncbi:MAG: hypothetical protein AAF141_07740 [Pseudomonadota bacterium]